MAGTSPIGLICAIPQERIDLCADLEHDRQSAIGSFNFDQGRLDGHPVVLAEAGIGKVNTAAVATLLAARFDARVLVFSGVAGGLDPDLAIGDLVIATRAVQHDCGVIENQRLQPYQAGHVPFFNPTRGARLCGRTEAARAHPDPARGLGPAAALGAGRRRGPAPAPGLRHDPRGRSVHPLRGDARAAAPRVPGPGGRDGGRRARPGRRAARRPLARDPGTLGPRRQGLAHRLRRLRRARSRPPRPRSCGVCCRRFEPRTPGSRPRSPSRHRSRVTLRRSTPLALIRCRWRTRTCPGGRCRTGRRAPSCRSPSRAGCAGARRPRPAAGCRR